MLKKDIFYISLLALILAATIVAGLFWERLQAPSSNGAPVTFEIKKGEGARKIAENLKAANLIRSRDVFLVYATLAAEVRHFQTGLYELSPQKSSPEIIRMLVRGENKEVIVTIPEGSSFFDIDQLLSSRGVLAKGSLNAKALAGGMEGKLFPDTYRFFLNTRAEDAVAKMHTAFDDKIVPLLPKDEIKSKEILILASILEKEVASEEDRQIVAGILLKRIALGIPLQVDASVCYGKRLKSQGDPCYPVTLLDTKTDGPYNTYLHTGWPPGPIGNPGIAAVQAALSPVKTPYMYYLSDPVTKQTIFSKTLEEHENNRSKYLLNR